MHGCALKRLMELALSPCAEETDPGDLDQTWQSLLWIPPSDEDSSKRGMLRLDDELAGLTEAAEVPANQHDTHTTKPEPLLSLQGEVSVMQIKSAAAAAASRCD